MAVQRDEKGRLLPGSTLNPKGGGRPRTEDAEKLQAALSALLSNGTLPKWQASMKKRLERGDQWATEFVFERITGKVPSGLELTGADGGPVELLKTYVTISPDDWNAAPSAVQPATVAD
jgi:hypothetical protein